MPPLRINLDDDRPSLEDVTDYKQLLAFIEQAVEVPRPMLLLYKLRRVSFDEPQLQSASFVTPSDWAAHMLGILSKLGVCRPTRNGRLVDSNFKEETKFLVLSLLLHFFDPSLLREFYRIGWDGSPSQLIQSAFTQQPVTVNLLVERYMESPESLASFENNYDVNSLVVSKDLRKTIVSIVKTIVRDDVELTGEWPRKDISRITSAQWTELQEMLGLELESGGPPPPYPPPPLQAPQEDN